MKFHTKDGIGTTVHNANVTNYTDVFLWLLVIGGQ